MSDLKGFYDESREGETLTPKLPDGTYVFQVVEAMVDTWPDGRPRLVISTRVAAGDYTGVFGPRITLSVGGSSGTVKKTGAPFTITDEQAASTLAVTIKNIHPEKIAIRNPGSFDQAMLDDIAQALTDQDTFIGRVKEGEDGYVNFTRSGIYSVKEPPRKFVDPRRATAFSL